MTCDYFLYDNRTWTWGIGCDWGIKAATGALAERSDLKAAFLRYCAALPSESGALRGFGQALGGLRRGGGYLLCVTLETRDPFNRPSWATYGLWCADARALGDALATDVVGSVRAVVSLSMPPSKLSLSRTPMALPSPRRLLRMPSLRKFDARISIAEVVSLLLGALHVHGVLPNVLAITASSRYTTLAEEFDVAYCHPPDAYAERMFAAVCNDDPLAPLPDEVVGDAPAIDPKRSTRRLFHWIAASVVLAGGITAVVMTWPRWLVPDFGGHYAFPAEQDGSAETEAVLARFVTSIGDVRALSPDELLQSSGEHQENASDAYRALLNDRQHVLALAEIAGGNERSKSPSGDSFARLLRIRAELDTRAFGAACEDITEPNDTTRQWCDALVRLDQAAEPIRSIQPVSLPAAERSTFP